MALLWLIHGGGPNYLLIGMILQVKNTIMLFWLVQTLTLLRPFALTI